MKKSSKFTPSSSTSRERFRNSVKIDRQEEQPNPGRSKEPLGLGGHRFRDKPTTNTTPNTTTTAAKVFEPEVFEVDNDSDSEPEVIYEKKGSSSSISRKNNDVIEVSIDSDSEGEPVVRRHSRDSKKSKSTKSDWLGATTTESSSSSSSGSSSVIQIESDMEEETKSMGDNDVDMIDQDFMNDIADHLWESSYLNDVKNVLPTDEVVGAPEPAPMKTEVPEECPVVLEEKEPEVIDAEEVPIEEVAAERKRLGNEYFGKGEYHQAYKMYSTAIDLVPTEAAYFGNRSACLLMMNKYKEAAKDARTALSLDPNLKNGYIRLARSTLALGDVTACELAIASAEAKPELKLDLSDEKQKLVTLKHIRKEIGVSDERKDFRKTLYLTERAKDIAPGDVSLKIKRAEALIRLGRYIEAQEQCTEILQTDGMIVEAITLRAYCFYQADNLEKALQYYKQALTLAPDNRSAAVYYKKVKQIKELREAGAEKFRLRSWSEAQNAYKQCLDIIEAEEDGNAVLASKLNFNLALVAGKSGDSELSLSYVNKALSLNPKYVKALMHRASIYYEQEKFEEAIRDYEAVEKLDSQTTNIRRLIEDSKLMAKKAKRKDYYKILGIDKKASTDEIKKAYKKRALDHHPDRHANATESERRDQEKKFKEVLEAYEILLDDKKRRRYDMGLDINESASSNYEPFDASAMFGHMFFQHAGMGGMGGRPGGFHQFRAGPGYSGFRR